MPGATPIDDESPRVPVYTVGHGSRSLPELVTCLKSFDVRTVADVRSWPSSRRHPQFDRESLEPSLTAEFFTYRWLGRELGGFRSEGYDSHMKTELFREGMRTLRTIIRRSRTALLCAETDPAGCHRRFLASALEAEGFEVCHIVAPGRILLPGERPEDQGTLFPI